MITAVAFDSCTLTAVPSVGTVDLQIGPAAGGEGHRTIRHVGGLVYVGAVDGEQSVRARRSRPSWVRCRCW